MKRKVEDISHKLELLYDLLRDGSLSHEILHGLHYIAQGELSSRHPLLSSNSLLFLVSFISVLASPHPLFLLSPLLVHRHSGHELLWCIDEVESNGVLEQPVRDQYVHAGDQDTATAEDSTAELTNSQLCLEFAVCNNCSNCRDLLIIMSCSVFGGCCIMLPPLTCGSY